MSAKTLSRSMGASAQGAIANNALGQSRLLARLPKGAHLVCEASGGYEGALVSAAHRAGIALSVVNPRQVRDFARGVGRRTKSDPIDAEMLAHFGTEVKPPAESAALAMPRLPWPSWSPLGNSWSRNAPSCCNSALSIASSSPLVWIGHD
jgi:transposase